MKKMFKITGITIYTIYALWTIFVCGSYAIAWATSPSYSHLRMGEEMSFVNFVINGLFILTLAADAAQAMIKARKAREK